MTQKRLDELDEIVEELLIFSNVDVFSMYSCNRVSENVPEITYRERDYIYFSLRLKGNTSYMDSVSYTRAEILEAE